MRPDDLDDRDLLAALVAGELSRDDDAVQRRLARSPELAAELAELDAVRRDLDEMREVLADPAPDAPALDTEAMTRAFVRERDGARARPRPVLRLALVAAAAAVLAVLIARPWAVDDLPPNDPLLGQDELQLTPHDAAVLPDEGFGWQPVRGARYYRMEIVSEGGAPSQTSPPQLSAPTWVPSPTDFAALPQRFRWRVRAYDGSDELLRTSRWARSYR